jgi:hypothetical protein
MTELLALPGWNTPPTPLEAWSEALRSAGHPVATTRESTGVAWLEVGALRLRGYAVLQGDHVEAINFELAGTAGATGPETDPARTAVERAAAALGWEVHEDDGEEDDVDDEDGAS